ncbi:MAG: DNA polymerase [Candidatus Coprovivens sp.]
MIFLISKNRSLFKSNLYNECTLEEALEWLIKLEEVEVDTETMGLDCHTKDLLTIQLGNPENQYVFDWTTLTKEERQVLKNYLESDKLLIGVNLMFDLTFLYKQGIWPKRIYDLMIAEQLIYLGYPKVLTAELVNELGIEFPMYEQLTKDDGTPYYELSYSLKAMAKRYLGINVDKTVRGAIINEGLTERVVQYAAGDVMWLSKIKEKQLIALREQELEKACEFECSFVRALAYTKYCGVHLNAKKWQDKMNNDNAKLSNAISKLNEWVVNWDKNRTHTGDWDIKYPGIDFDERDADFLNNLIKNGYKRSPEDDLDSPNGKIHAYKKKVKSLFTKIDRQGDLFTGFNTEPQCTINWASNKQVVPFFELLGINCDGFDKKTKRKKKTIEEAQLLPQKDKFPIISLFLEYQEAAKVVSTYGQNWLNAINPKTGRIHVDFHVIGTDTSRISSGGGPYKLNLQNLPHDEVTRGCFTSENGNIWLSCDYSGQESAITASVSRDKAMIEILQTGGDLHSEVAKACWPDLLGNLTDAEIKSKYKSYRQDAKGVEFGIFYGGDDNTLVANKGFKPDVAKSIYDNFMSKFSGIREYQDYCRKAVMAKGYILMNPVLKHRAHIFDSPWLMLMQNKFKEDGFWEYYREMKTSNPQCDTVQKVKRYFRRKSDSERQSINYRVYVCGIN